MNYNIIFLLFILMLQQCKSIECEENTYYDGTTCVECSSYCVENYCNPITGCELCEKDYIVFNKTCVDNTCSSTCKIGKCENGKCLECIENYILVDEICYENTCDHCELGSCHNGFCGDCIEGYYVFHAACHKCIDGCKIDGCIDGVGCVECQQGMELKAGKCVVVEVVIIQEDVLNWKLGYFIVVPIFCILLFLNSILFLLFLFQKKRKERTTQLYRYD